MIKYNNVLECQADFGNMCTHAQQIVNNSQKLETSVYNLQHKYVGKVASMIESQTQHESNKNAVSLSEVDMPSNELDGLLNTLSHTDSHDHETLSHLESKVLHSFILPPLKELGSGLSIEADTQLFHRVIWNLLNFGWYLR